jgi:hypothetical protein
MRRRQRATIEELRRAIDCLPVKTRVAMLDGIRTTPIIVGAYTDGHGGVCPMLAAHRAGGRTDFISFARVWDRFGDSGRHARRATQRELRILTTHLEASLAVREEPTSELGEAVREHRELLMRRRHAADSGGERGAAGHARPSREGTRPGDADRSGELQGRPGWAWLQVFRRYDDYERALARVESEREALRDVAELDRRPQLVG